MKETNTSGALGLRIVSAIPSGVVGAEALIEVSGVEAPRLILNGRQVDVTWSADSSAGVLRTLLAGLAQGDNLIEAACNGRREQLRLISFPVEGPIISGPHMTPWMLTTEQSGLGPPLDEHGNAAPAFSFHYMSASTGKFAPYDPADPPPRTEIATTTNDAGVDVPYIVRREIGAANRGIYELAVLFDPDRPWSALEPQKGWNRKLWIYLYGGWGQHWSQSELLTQQAPPPAPPHTILMDMGLRRGFMVARMTFLQSATNSDTVRGAEALMMLKEHISKRYGLIRYTLSTGSSGGSIMQQMIANQYPGLIQGMVVMSSLHASWYVPGVIIDSRLLQHYFTATSPNLWQSAQERLAVDGHSREQTAAFFTTSFGGKLFDMIVGGADPTWGTTLPAGQTYHSEHNPAGIRGTLQEYQVNYLGRRKPAQWTQPERAAGRGFAPLVWENLGVQYGLGALLEGRISTEQFVDLNEKIGGIDIDNGATPSRTEADPDAVARAHRGGFLNDFVNMDTVAILDVRPPEKDDLPSHTQFHTWVTRAGLIAAHGHADNQATWMMPGFFTGFAPPDAAFVLMDQWLAAIDADPSEHSLAAKIVAHKPRDLVDGVYDPSGNRTGDMKDYHTLYPSAGDARTVAACGNLAAHRIIKPQLKPLDCSDYPGVTFTDDQWVRLERTFPKGVADWSKPGVGQTPTIPWLDYASGPGGKPFSG